MSHGGTNNNMTPKLSGINRLKSLCKRGEKNQYELGNIKKVLFSLNNPQEIPYTIHVAGTNGKGSVCAAVSQILVSFGYRVGCTISPHLLRINERILYNSDEISNDELNSYLLKVFDKSDLLEIKLSYFEALIAVAYLYFSEKECDFQIIEVGLGGRLDATNIVKRDKISVIVSIDYDHTELLGDTLYQIAYEKACIINDGSKVILGQVSQEAFKGIEKRLREVQLAKIRIINKDFGWLEGKIKNCFFTKSRDGERNIVNFNPSLLGKHQLNNMAVALEVCNQVVPEKLVQAAHAISHVTWPGRIEVIENKEKGNFIVDGAHNPAGVKSLLSYLKEQRERNYQIIFGVLASKNWKEMINELAKLFKNWIVLEIKSEQQSVKSAQLAEYLSCIGIKNISTAQDIKEAILISDHDKIKIICGSLYMIGDAREELLKRN
jgi:dihydrofolate synthase/folylpolyglutamate synthase